VAPRFPTVGEVPDDVNVRRLIAKFSDYAEEIIAIVDIE
jgi:hypothetical protein